ncbi:kinesin light chain 1 [Phaeosphaeria sp. MPI-PUGE-AT-0046c]|nr:kinesin light chain 1 [Phaeosphaeria sp. MPI-PUGE-AT-0046c]
MRLLTCSNTEDLSFTKDLMEDADVPPYAILSHTWGDQEVLFNDLLGSAGRDKAGYDKIRFCTQQARRDNLYHCWIDTCCINKHDPIELQDAINSMFRWYARAARCYVFLSDVSTNNGLSSSTWEASFRASRWFTRGWTLQELLAPRQVTFFSREGDKLGDRTSLERQIHEITGISMSALRATPLDAFTVTERLSWAAGRTTTRKEDRAYSLLGIFGVFLPPIYGEGNDHAFKRLYREIDATAGRFLVPFNRPRGFSGRERQLEQLHAHIISDRCQHFAVHGLGGCGKTALALETVYWTREHHPTCAVFWVPAFSRDSLEDAFYQIAKLLNMPDIESNRAGVIELVRATLSDNDFGPWLMVVDNADDETVLFGPPSHTNGSNQLIQYLPRSHHGSIIFTTRTQATAIRLAGANTMALEELDKADAIAILSRNLLHEHQPQLSDASMVDELLGVLHFHALALVQAISFMNTNNITISEYTNLCRDNEKDAADLLSEDFEDQGRYQGTTNSVAMTWYISFEQLKKEHHIAADHLCFMACTACNAIDASMFPPLYTRIEHVKAIGTLKAYAFVTEQRSHVVHIPSEAQKSDKKFDVHPLVHLATRSWLKAHRQWALWTETTLGRLVDIVPYGDHDTREYWQAYLHHAMQIVDIPELNDLDARMSLLERVGRCQRSIGRYQTAERAYRQALDQRMRTSGQEHVDSLMAMGNIGLILGYQEKWPEAEKMHREELVIARKVLGERNPQTLVTRGNIALAVLGQCKYDEAEPMCREVLGLNKESLGDKHPDTLASMQNLAGALCGQGRHTEAESLHRETLALRRATFGALHADTLSSLSALGTALQSQRKYSEAENIHREELALRIESMQKLGHIQRKALVISEKVSGPLRPVTEGKFADAEQIHRETLATKEKVLGKAHRVTLLSVYWLAEAVHDQARYRDALPLYERALRGFETVFGMEHKMTKECAEQVSVVQEALVEERVNEAKEKQHADTVAGASSTASQSDASEMAGTSKPQKRWRARLQKMVKKVA